MKPIHCYILDDEREARERLAMLLGKFDELKIIGIQGDPDIAIEEIQHKKPDIVFVDVEMPKKNGFDVVKEVEAQDFHAVFVFVTAYNHYAIKAIRNAAFDYLVKPVDIDELSDTIKRYKVTDRARIAEQLIDHEYSSAIELSKREIEVVRLIAHGKKSKEIANALFISKRTVDTHRRNILEKTGLNNAQELILWAIERKIV